MRDRIQLELTVPEYHDAQRVARQRAGAQFAAEMKRVRETLPRPPDWYIWILKRQRGEHDHGLKRADGSRAACPVHGCDIVGNLG